MEKLDQTHLFNHYQEGCIWAFNDGIMGECYGNEESAVIISGDFAFVEGIPSTQILDYIKKYNYMIIIPSNDEWINLINQYLSNIDLSKRYAIKKERDIFNIEHLDSLINQLDERYIIKQINEEIYEQCIKEKWSKDFVFNYQNYSFYQQYGLGYVIMHDDQIIAGASSYCSFKDGIEVEIVTRKDYRKQGLATIIGAKLVRECINQGLYPSWDARIYPSVKLAEKLGYHYDHEYPVCIYHK